MMERVQFVGWPQRIPVKRDQFGADLMAMSDTRVVFIQVKYGEPRVAHATREFEKYVWPPFVERHVVAWRPRAREPEVYEV